MKFLRRVPCFAFLVGVVACSSTPTAAPGSDKSQTDAGSDNSDAAKGTNGDAGSDNSDAGSDPSDAATGADVVSDQTHPADAARAARLPLITPPVRAATPAGLVGTSALAAPAAVRFVADPSAANLDSSDIKSRFFTAGPTDIFRILGDIDQRITDINSQSDAPCLSQTPVAYTLTPFGESVTFYAQCYQNVSVPSPGGAAFLQFGTQDGATYFYSLVGAGPVAARVAPVPGVGGAYTVHAWIGIADGQRTGGSHGVIEIEADSSRTRFEMAVAGIGFGYCGAQLKSDGAKVYAAGSVDMGSTCNATASLCVAASDVTTPDHCDAPFPNFALPALGRIATSITAGPMAASLYPGGAANAIVLDGSANDSATFGPLAPTPGTSEFGVKARSDASP